jgi:hypothetical protein
MNMAMIQGATMISHIATILSALSASSSSQAWRNARRTEGCSDLGRRSAMLRALWIWDPVGVVDDAIEDRIGECGLPEHCRMHLPLPFRIRTSKVEVSGKPMELDIDASNARARIETPVSSTSWPSTLPQRCQLRPFRREGSKSTNVRSRRPPVPGAPVSAPHIEPVSVHVEPGLGHAETEIEK